MSIHPKTRIGAVHLTVSDLDRSVDFYIQHLGLVEQSRKAATATLGAGDVTLLVLKESPGAAHPRRTTGLYHFAILVPSRLHLARSLRHFADLGTRMQGFSDHGVSEALYLADPDGIGIEVYRDRPRDEWKWVDGRLAMTLDPLDVEGLLRDAEADRRGGGPPWSGLASGTTMGHVHLRVSFLEDTERFYRSVLGFDLTQRYGDSALFLSAGGYHHHLAANVWAGVGAPRPPDGAIGLDHFEILLPEADALADVGRRLSAAGAEAKIGESRIDVRDPSGNAIVLL